MAYLPWTRDQLERMQKRLPEQWETNDLQNLLSLALDGLALREATQHVGEGVLQYAIDAVQEGRA